MDLTFANPLGFWALLGLPAVVAIHFLQRRSRPAVITTLFLLESLRRESETGHRFERLRTSLPFWLQLLMVLALTWLLVQPRWKREESVQRLAVVLDASTSMQAFRDRALSELGTRLAALAAPATTNEYTLLTSAPEAPSLYHGTSLADTLTAGAAWQPWLGEHDPTPALRTARSLTGREGIVIFVTDRPPAAELPYAARFLAVGEPFDNGGFAGVTTEEREGRTVFRALARNFSGRAQSRSWWIEANGQRSPETPLEFAPGQSHTVQAAFPDSVDRCWLVLSGDRFTADDRLPLVRPAPKILSLALPPRANAATAALHELFASFPHLTAPPADTTPDVVVALYDPLAPALPEANAVVFAGDPQPGAAYGAGLLLPEPGPLMEGLNWQSLLVRDTLAVPRAREDRVLLWQAERPLILLRATAGRRQLIFNFDLQTSNARKLPALAVLLYRFLEERRAEKIAPETLNAVGGQKLVVAHHQEAGAPPLVLTPETAPNATETAEPESPAPASPRTGMDFLRAPLVPGFFTVTQGGQPLLTAAAAFADPNESDFTSAGTGDTLQELTSSLVEQHSAADANWRLWVLLLLAALVASWWAGGRHEARVAKASHPPRRAYPGGVA